MLLRFLRNQKGFTMIEMMVVLIIIGVLIGAGIYLYSGYIDKAKVTKATGEISTMQAALDTYYAEKNEYPGATYTALQEAGLPAGTDESGTGAVIGPAGEGKKYEYSLSGDKKGYAINTADKVDGKNYVFGKGREGRSTPLGKGSTKAEAPTS